MKKKFLKLYEGTITRYNNGGYLVGDIVKIKPNAFNHPKFEGDEELKAQVKALMDSDLNIRVINIMNQYPAVMGANNTDNINPFGRTIEIAQEIAPGRLYNKVSVPDEILVRVDFYPNLPPIPKSFKREDTSQIKPKEHTAKHANDEMSNKNINLGNTNVKLDHAIAAKPTTAMYLPKEKRR